MIADSDSRWKWGATLAPRLAPDGDARVHATLLWGRSTPNAQQLRDVGVQASTLHRASVGETVARLADSTAQVVVLACMGGAVQALLQGLSRAWAGRSQRPVVVTGYVGLVYEHVIDGLLARTGADILLANSEHDLDLFRAALRAVGVDPESVVRTALPFLGGAPHDPTAAGRDRPFTLTFAAQPGVPQAKAERRYALAQAIEHAARHPQRHVVVKLRGRLGERTTHVEPFHYASLLPDADLPDNLEIAYGPMAPILDRTDLCVTISSTAAVEAMHRSIPTGILVDFGVREVLGNHVFLNSGALTSWRALHDGDVPVVDPQWAGYHGVLDDDPYSAPAKRVAELVGEPLPPLQPWFTIADSAAYLPALMTRYGLDADGSPSASSSAGGQAPLHSRLVRAAARRAYGVGVRVLEPRIKRIAQL